jgi:hypothetical protein
MEQQEQQREWRRARDVMAGRNEHRPSLSVGLSLARKLSSSSFSCPLAEWVTRALASWNGDRRSGVALLRAAARKETDKKTASEALALSALCAPDAADSFSVLLACAREGCSVACAAVAAATQGGGEKKKWAERAAAGGEPQGWHVLAICHLRGWDDEEAASEEDRKKKAVSALERAARGGWLDAMLLLSFQLPLLSPLRFRWCGKVSQRSTLSFLFFFSFLL